MKNKVLIFFTTILSIITIYFKPLKVESSNVNDNISQQVQVQSNTPKWTTVINEKEKKYKNLVVDSSFSGDQIIVPQSIRVQYGHIDGEGNFNVIKTDDHFEDYKIVGNNVTFNFKNIDSAIKITYNSQGRQVGKLTNTVSLKNNGGVQHPVH